MIWRSITPRRDLELSARKAVAGGRCVCVRNLDYAVKKDEIFKLFADHDFPVEKVDMPIDPFTSRNPSYCFADFRSAGRAVRVMRDMNGLIFVGRPLDLRPGQSMRGGGKHEAGSYKFDRYLQADEACEHWHARVNENRRIYVGGLPRPDNRYKAEQFILKLFKDYKSTAISKTMPTVMHPYDLNEFAEDNYFIAFMDFADEEEGKRAVHERNGMLLDGHKITVKRSQGKASWKVYERQILDIVADAKERSGNVEM